MLNLCGKCQINLAIVKWYFAKGYFMAARYQLCLGMKPNKQCGCGWILRVLGLGRSKREFPALPPWLCMWCMPGGISVPITECKNISWQCLHMHAPTVLIHRSDWEKKQLWHMANLFFCLLVPIWLYPVFIQWSNSIRNCFYFVSEQWKMLIVAEMPSSDSVVMPHFHKVYTICFLLKQYSSRMEILRKCH